MKKRGQVTLFIILGIILLLTIALIFYLLSRTTVFEPTIVVPQELIPVQRHIENCLLDRSEQGLALMGAQAGYITIPEEIRNSRDSYLQRGPNIVPYWYYDGQNRVPTIDDMQNDLARYVNESVAVCTDLSSFEDSFTFEFVERARNIERQVVVDIQEDDVSVRLDYPIIARDLLSEQETNLLQFQVRLDVPLRKMHELALEVLRAETYDTFFEEATINFMSIHPDIPFTRLELKCGELTWHVDEIRETLQGMVAQNLNDVRIRGTDVEEFEDSNFDYEQLRDLPVDENGAFVNPLPDNIPSDTYEYFQLYFDADIDDTRYDDLKMKFRYDPSFGMDITANPSDNGQLSSVHGQGPRGLLPFLCINSYHFTYDVDYPVEARIVDTEAYRGQGYTFKYAFPVNIRTNRPDKTGLPHSFIETPLQFDNEEFCGALGADPRSVTVRGISEDGFFEPLPFVNVSLQCINQVCKLGETGTGSASSAFALGQWRDFMPETCSNPFIIAEKEGYITRREQMLDDSLDITLEKAKAFTFDVVKHSYFSDRDIPELAPEGIPLTNSDTAAIRVTLQDEDVNNIFVQDFVYPTNFSLFLAEGGATYSFDIKYFRDDILVGGYVAQNITLDESTIASGDHVTFHVFDFRPAPVGINEDLLLDFMIYLNEGTYAQELAPIVGQSVIAE